MGFEEFFAKLADLTLAIAPLVPILAGLVEFFKIIGLPSDAWAVGASMVLGILITVLIQASVMYPAIEPWLLAVIVGALAGMTTTGLYTIGARWSKRRS